MKKINGLVLLSIMAFSHLQAMDSPKGISYSDQVLNDMGDRLAYFARKAHASPAIIFLRLKKELSPQEREIVEARFEKVIKFNIPGQDDLWDIADQINGHLQKCKKQKMSQESFQRELFNVHLYLSTNFEKSEIDIIHNRIEQPTSNAIKELFS